MKFHLLYTFYCSLKVKSFETEAEMKRFVADFLANRPNNDDHFVDGMFFGQLGWFDESIGVNDG